MKKIPILLCLLLLLCGCSPKEKPVQVVASTQPVYEFSSVLCEGTDISVAKLVTQPVSCLHDYTLQANQMQLIEHAKVIIISGAGLEEFLEEPLENTNCIDASIQVDLLCPHDDHNHNGHDHEADPHIWLSPANAKIMTQNICDGLRTQFPQYESVFLSNLSELHKKLDALEQYGQAQLSSLSYRNLITFHDGFAYFADAFDLKILMAIEEESGSEASAYELIHLIRLVHQEQLPAIFTEENGSISAASVVASETGIQVYPLDMAMSERNYFDAMYYNIDTIKEALG